MVTGNELLDRESGTSEESEELHRVQDSDDIAVRHTEAKEIKESKTADGGWKRV